MADTGDRFGSLTVVSLIGYKMHSRNRIKNWLCKCDCGRTAKADQNSLTKGLISACKVCRRGPCVICGSPITNESYAIKRNTCGDFCRNEQKKRKDRKTYAKKMLSDPDTEKKRYHSRLKEDPLLNKKKYAAHQEKLKNMGEDEQKIIIDRANKQTNKWRKSWLHRLKKEDTEAYQEFLKKSRRSYRAHKQRKELSQLLKLQQTLTDKNNE